MKQDLDSPSTKLIKTYLLEEEKIIRINGKSYVCTADKETLVDLSQTFTPLFFVRTRKHAWFPDSPAIGCAQWAFRESRMEGPFYTQEAAETAQQELTIDLKKSDCHYTVETELLALALSEEEAQDIHIRRYWRHSLRMAGHDSAYRSIHTIFAEVPLRDLFSIAVSKLKTSQEHTSRDDRLIGIINGIFYCLFQKRCPQDYSNNGGPLTPILALDSFGPEQKSTLWHILDADPLPYRQKAESWTTYDLHESSEAFITLHPATLSMADHSLEDFLKKGNFMPLRLEERLGMSL